MERTAEPDLTQKIDAIEQNEREQRAGVGQNHPDGSQQSSKEDERLRAVSTRTDSKGIPFAAAL